MPAARRIPRARRSALLSESLETRAHDVNRSAAAGLAKGLGDVHAASPRHVPAIRHQFQDRESHRVPDSAHPSPDPADRALADDRSETTVPPRRCSRTKQSSPQQRLNALPLLARALRANIHSLMQDAARGFKHETSPDCQFRSGHITPSLKIVDKSRGRLCHLHIYYEELKREDRE